MQFWRKLQPRFSLLTLLAVVTLFAVGFAAWRQYEIRVLRREKLIREYERKPGFGFRLEFEETFEHSDGERYRVFVFDSLFKSWPGNNSYWIVVTTNDHVVSFADIFGGDEKLVSVEMTTDKERMELSAYCRHRRRGGGGGTYRYRILPKSVERIGDVIWDDTPIEIPAFQSRNLRKGIEKSPLRAGLK